MSSCYPMASRHGMLASHAMSGSQKLSRLNLDALAVPEALVNTIRILAMFPTRVNDYSAKFILQKITPRIYFLDPYNRLRNAPMRGGGAFRALGIAKTLLFKKLTFPKNITFTIFNIFRIAQ